MRGAWIEEPSPGTGVNLSYSAEIMKRHAPLVIFLTGVVLLFPSIWSETSITGRDEYWLSLRTPMETIARGDWLTPWVNGEPRLKKPPLLYWAIALSYELLGIHLVAARMWGVLCGAGLAVCSCCISRELFAKGGVLAGLMTLGTVGVAIQGRLAMIDLPLAFAVSLAVWLSLRWWKSGGWSPILGASLCLGASFLLKGPIGFYFFASSAITGLIVFKGWNVLWARLPQLVVSGLLIAAVSIPWPLAMAHMWPQYVGTLGEEFGARHFGDWSIVSPFSALGGALGLVFPWSLVLIAAVLHTLIRRKEPWDRRRLWLVFWYLFSVLPFFFMRTFERYMLPLIPPICVLCCEWLEEVEDSIRILMIQISMYMTAIVALLISLFSLWFGIGIVSAVLNLTLVMSMLWGAHQAGKLKPAGDSPAGQRIAGSGGRSTSHPSTAHPLSRYIHASVGAIALLLAVIMGGLYPSLGINAMPDDVQDVVGDLPAGVFRSSQPSMLSMRLKRSVIPVSLSDGAAERSLARFDGVVFVEEVNAASFEKATVSLGLMVTKVGHFRTFFSRKAWLRFTREGTTWEDWRRAIRGRSLEDLKSAICYYRVQPKDAP